MSKNNARYWKGKERDESTKKKISIGHKGKERSYASGENHPMYGKEHSVQHKEKIRESMIGKNAGEKHWNWKGGKTKRKNRIRQSGKYRKWREKVFRRDNYTCQDCGVNGGNLHPHHIKSFSKYPNLRFNIKNGMTLCKECHMKTDNYRRRVDLI